MKIQTRTWLNKHAPDFAQKLAQKAMANSPTILFGVGVAATIGGTVLACRATLKAQDKFTDFSQEVESVRLGMNELTQYRRDLTYVYVKNSLEIVKPYIPAIVVGGVGIACLATSHSQLKSRNEALVAAYAAVQGAFDRYRDRVREEIGEERELDLYHAAETTQVLLDDGKAVEVKSADPTKWSPYAKFFDEGSKHWQPDAELNRLWIDIQQRYLNQLLAARGFVFLNEAYEALGVEWSSAGQAVGWIMNGDGDNYIDFGMYKATNANFINGHEPNILLDFNVDGTIIDKIG